MAQPTTYSFYGTTIPALQNLTASAISFLTAAKAERANNNNNNNNDATGKPLPSEEEILNTNLGDMLPFRLQPILLAKFSVVAIQEHQLNGTTPFPELSPAFTSLDDVIAFFRQLRAAYDAIEEPAFNDCADKSASVSFANVDLTLHMSSMADYFHGFVIPNSFFHLNAMYMMLRSVGFKLSKDAYIGPWMSQQQLKDWEPLKVMKSKQA